jgi:hypothetical protein
VIGIVSTLALAGLVAAPAAAADTGIAPPAPAPEALAAVEATVDPVVEAVVEPVSEPVTEPLTEAPAPDAGPAAEPVGAVAKAVAETVVSAQAAVAAAAPAPVAAPAPRPAAARTAPAPQSRPTHVRPTRAAPVEDAPTRSRESSPGAAAHLDRRGLVTTLGERVTKPASAATAAKQPVAPTSTAPQRLPVPAAPSTTGDPTGAVQGFVLLFLAVVIALFSARSWLGERLTLLLASPRGAALVLELERPG